MSRLRQAFQAIVSSMWSKKASPVSITPSRRGPPSSTTSASDSRVSRRTRTQPGLSTVTCTPNLPFISSLIGSPLRSSRPHVQSVLGQAAEPLCLSNAARALLADQLHHLALEGDERRTRLHVVVPGPRQGDWDLRFNAARPRRHP